MREAKLARKTRETDIKLSLQLDGKGQSSISTGIGFFDHMLTGFARHGLFNLDIKAEGDLQVDGHHTVEDTGIVLGTAIKEAAGDKKGMQRYGYFILPMDDALVLCSIDFSGRPYLNFDMDFPTERCGYFENELMKEFFYAVSYSAGMNIHIKKLAGENAHHIAEATFKAFAKALDMATRLDPRIEDVLSTKGKL
ncbi:MAG: imidazoleglycerol-phosphate dehydratase HisB [Lachnospiraceae bacterium]